MKQFETVNDIGIRLIGTENELLKSLTIYPESGEVQVWVAVREQGRGLDGRIFEAMQYLTPAEAMALSKAFERCAVAALLAKD